MTSTKYILGQMRMISIIILVCALTACEGIVGGDGRIYSLVTKDPLDSVEVVLYLNDHAGTPTYSDQSGFFRGSKFVGCVPSCPDAKVELKKDGYETKIIDFNEFWKENEYNPHLRDSLVIFMRPLKN
jgi:hypothetical protein